MLLYTIVSLMAVQSLWTANMYVAFAFRRINDWYEFIESQETAQLLATCNVSLPTPWFVFWLCQFCQLPGWRFRGGLVAYCFWERKLFDRLKTFVCKAGREPLELSGWRWWKLRVCSLANSTRTDLVSVTSNLRLQRAYWKEWLCPWSNPVFFQEPRNSHDTKL